MMIDGVGSHYRPVRACAPRSIPNHNEILIGQQHTRHRLPGASLALAQAPQMSILAGPCGAIVTIRLRRAVGVQRHLHVWRLVLLCERNGIGHPVSNVISAATEDDVVNM